MCLDKMCPSLWSCFYFPEPKSNSDFGYCEAGLSAEYMKDPPNSVIFGAVGSKQWAGRRLKAFYFQNKRNHHQYFRLRVIPYFAKSQMSYAKCTCTGKTHEDWRCKGSMNPFSVFHLCMSCTKMHG